MPISSSCKCCGVRGLFEGQAESKRVLGKCKAYEDAPGVVLALEGELDSLGGRSGRLEGDHERPCQILQTERVSFADLLVSQTNPEEVIEVRVGVIVVGGETQGIVGVGDQAR
jgi:hypothetical protein